MVVVERRCDHTSYNFVIRLSGKNLITMVLGGRLCTQSVHRSRVSSGAAVPACVLGKLNGGFGEALRSYLV